MAATKNRKDLEKARTAEIFPLDKAVNNMLEKVLKPTSSNAHENSLFPSTAKAKAAEPACVNTETRALEASMDKMVVVTATEDINSRLMERSLFNFSVLAAP